MGSDWKGDKNILRRKQNVLIIKKKFLRGGKKAAMWVSDFLSKFCQKNNVCPFVYRSVLFYQFSITVKFVGTVAQNGYGCIRV